MRRLLLSFIGLIGLLNLVLISPAQSDESATNPRVVMETSAGQLTIELFADKAPLAVANFLAYVDNGFYSNTIFHRVIPSFMIQGGGFTEDMTVKETGTPVKNESDNDLHNLRGTLAMARTEDPDSAAAQFFINVRDNLQLDFNDRYGRPGYTVFGRVENGLDVVDSISLQETGDYGDMQDVPLQPVIIKSVTRLQTR